MYEVMSKEIAHLFTDRFVSPLGEDHKLRKLQLIDPEDSKKLTKAAKRGPDFVSRNSSWRLHETRLVSVWWN
jgi:hypothetical protein